MIKDSSEKIPEQHFWNPNWQYKIVIKHLNRQEAGGADQKEWGWKCKERKFSEIKWPFWLSLHAAPSIILTYSEGIHSGAHLLHISLHRTELLIKWAATVPQHCWLQHISTATVGLKKRCIQLHGQICEGEKGLLIHTALKQTAINKNLSCTLPVLEKKAN